MAPTPSDPFELVRFVEAQDDVIDEVRAQLSAGRKTSHWMWYVFPQIAGLGSSIMAQGYAIRGRREAEAYLAHPVLGPRLCELTALVTAIPGKSAHDIFGSPDDLKFRSCVTLFAAIAPREAVFRQALDRFFDGHADQRTLELLGAAP
ncbi:MAG: DUF1810 domain-containing protein [Proteobacteria bacterium]|nr:DUF1810 domain-containing protein [Pseudomonadota bacterium]